MKTTLRLVMGLVLASVIGAMVIATVGMAWMQAELPGHVLTIDSEQIVAGDFTARHWLIAVIALSAALLVLLTVLPLTLAFAFIVTGAALGVAFLAVLASLAWVTAPLWVALAILWWVLRSRRAGRGAAA
jgi:hypothetical protein